MHKECATEPPGGLTPRQRKYIEKVTEHGRPVAGRTPARSPRIGVAPVAETKTPWRGARAFRFGDPDDDLLSRDIPRTIIGATPFHGPVRDGKAWFQRAIVVRNSVVSVATHDRRASRSSAFGKKRRS